MVFNGLRLLLSYPSAIMSLHSKRKGGRQSSYTSTSSKTATEVVGEIILKGKAQFRDTPNVHYHQGMTQVRRP